jgi:hypothetical protein
MDEQFVKRWVVEIGNGRFMIFDDEADIAEAEADEVLEITIPATMATMLDFVQHSYYSMQSYLEAQWTLMQQKLRQDEPEYDGEFSGDDNAFLSEFDAIIRKNDWGSLGEEDR